MIDIFDGRSQLIAYFQMWHTGHSVAEQCEGCTFFNSQVRELSYLHASDVTYATFCEGPYDESVRSPSGFLASSSYFGPGFRTIPSPVSFWRKILPSA